MNDEQAEKVLKPVKILKLKPKDKLFVKKIVKDGKSGTDAYIETRDKSRVISRASARELASRKLSKVNIQNEIIRQLEVAGLTDEFTNNSLKDIIDAGLANKHWTKPAVALGALRTILELKDKFPAKKQLTATLNMDQEDMSNASIDELRDTVNKIHEENERIIKLLEDSNR